MVAKHVRKLHFNKADATLHDQCSTIYIYSENAIHPPIDSYSTYWVYICVDNIVQKVIFVDYKYSNNSYLTAG